MLTDLDPNTYAQRLRESQEKNMLISPLRDEIGITDLDFAYQIQDLNTKFKLEQGHRIVGKKIGLTSVAVQQQLGVDQPDYGVLFEDMEVLNGLTISMQELMQPKVEMEVAFVLKSDLIQENLVLTDIINAIDYALPAVEIVGSRIENWNIKITDTIADNASASHYVLGHQLKKLDQFDVINCPMRLYVNDALVSSGKGSDCLGSPLNATLWLAQKMQVVGKPLKAGEIILSGALGKFVEVQKGDQVLGEIEGLGTVTVGFD